MAAAPLLARFSRRIAFLLATAVLATVVSPSAAMGHPEHEDDATSKGAVTPKNVFQEQLAQIAAMDLIDFQAGLSSIGLTECSNGIAARFACNDVDLISFLPLSALGGGRANDIWGWTHQGSGRNYAILGRTDGVTFVEITNPLKPVVLGTLTAHAATSSPWRDLKVYNDHVFIVSEARGSGLQVFDLRKLVGSQPNTKYQESAFFDGFSTAHNIAINEETGFAYAVGTNTCEGGLHMIDIRQPTRPSDAGCFSADGYTHDTQCVIYHGPDSQYVDREICFASNEDTLTIVDVTDKTQPTQISRTGYASVGYTHQSWLTEDHTYMMADDELDESNYGLTTQTHVWNLSDLDAPVIDFTHAGPTNAVDHNQYVTKGYSYQANYTAGLRILTADQLASGHTKEVAYFDIHPESNGLGFNGAWSTYPFYQSGVVVVSGIESGLFILGYDGTGGSHHVADLDISARRLKRAKWQATVEVEVHHGNGDPVDGAIVEFEWNSGRSNSCTTQPNGRCTASLSRRLAKQLMTARVTSIQMPDSIYASWDNYDIDDETNGLEAKIRFAAAAERTKFRKTS